MKDKNGFERMIEAMKIFQKYSDRKYPFDGHHEEIAVNIEADKVSDKDKEKLDELGFHVDKEYNRFHWFT